MFEVMWGVKLVYVMPFDDLGHLVCMNSTHPNSHTEFPSDVSSEGLSAYGTHVAAFSSSNSFPLTEVGASTRDWSHF